MQNKYSTILCFHTLNIAFNYYYYYMLYFRKKLRSAVVYSFEIERNYKNLNSLLS